MKIPFDDSPLLHPPTVGGVILFALCQIMVWGSLSLYALWCILYLIAYCRWPKSRGGKS